MDNIIKEELEKITRRLDGIEKQLDLLYGDREILESVQGRLTSLEEQLKLNRQNDRTVSNDIKEEINLANDRVVAKVETKIEEGISAFGRSRTKTKSLIDKILKR